VSTSFATDVSGPVAPPHRPDRSRHLARVDAVPRWLHWWAILTLLMALPLVLLGAEVTTKQVGMVDPVSFRPPWHLFTLQLQELGLGYLIEHGHRLFGFLVGICAIVLALGLLLGTRHPLVRWLGLIALTMVVAQGLLGIFRVALNALFGSNLALIHGCFAQLVVATLVGVAVMTSRAWLEAPVVARQSVWLRRLSVGVILLLFVQIFLGGEIRHLQDRVAQRLHVLLAFGVWTGVLYLVWEQRKQRGPARNWSIALLGFLGLQVLLGVEAWLGRFGSGVPVELQQSTPYLDAIRSGHFLVGMLMFSSAVVVSLFMHRDWATAGQREVVL
jgi:cytochrome c oxidase assembly protein subunit 15